MIEIYNIVTGNVTKIHNASKKYKRKDSFTTYTRVGVKFLKNHINMFSHVIGGDINNEVILRPEYRVKGVDLKEESLFRKMFKWKI